MCCGQISKKAKSPVTPQKEVIPLTPELGATTPAPTPQNVVADNINSQRAAQTLSANYHKMRFGNGG